MMPQPRRSAVDAYAKNPIQMSPAMVEAHPSLFVSDIHKGLRTIEMLRIISDNFNNLILKPHSTDAKTVCDKWFVEQPDPRTNESPNPLTWYIVTNWKRIFRTSERFKASLFYYTNISSDGQCNLVQQKWGDYSAISSTKGKAKFLIGLPVADMKYILQEIRTKYSKNHNMFLTSGNDVTFTFKPSNPDTFIEEIRLMKQIAMENGMKADKFALTMNLGLRFYSVVV
jgi:hypothetical protein